MRGEITICCRNEGKNSIRCNRIDCRCSVVVRHTRLFRADSPIARCMIAGRNIHFVRAAGIIVRKSSARDEQKKIKRKLSVESLHLMFAVCTTHFAIFHEYASICCSMAAMYGGQVGMFDDDDEVESRTAQNCLQNFAQNRLTQFNA